MYTNFNYKKYIIKNILIISFILFVAAFSTYAIYNHFSKKDSYEYSSKSLNINFHEEQGENIDIFKIVPLNDSVGLASKAHTFTVKNNLTMPANFQIELLNNEKKVEEDSCEEYQIPHENIKISLKKAGESPIVYKLSEIENGLLKEVEIAPLVAEKYTIRAWVSNDNLIQSGSNYHYHGKIVIKEIENKRKDD